MYQCRSQHAALAVTVFLFTHLMYIFLSIMSVIVAVLMNVIMHVSTIVFLTLYIVVNYVLGILCIFCRSFAMHMPMLILMYMTVSVFYPLHFHWFSETVQHKSHYIARYNCYNSLCHKNLCYSSGTYGII